MKFIPLEIDGAYLIKLSKHEDERGFFARSFCETEFEQAGLWSHYPQHNISFNKVKGTLRGMHYQIAPHEEVKVVSCARGEIFDVIVDIRPDSPSFGKHQQIVLTEDGLDAVYVPAGVAHGFQTLKDDTLVSYLMGTAYQPGSAAGFRYDDEKFGINWPLPVATISRRDLDYGNFSATNGKIDSR